MLSYFALLYVRAMYFAVYWMAYSTLTLYLLWGEDINHTVIRTAPVALAIISAAMTDQPNAIRQRKR